MSIFKLLHRMVWSLLLLLVVVRVKMAKVQTVKSGDLKDRYKIRDYKLYKLGRKSKKVFRATRQSLGRTTSGQLVLAACLSVGPVVYKDRLPSRYILATLLLVFLCYIQIRRTRKREEKRYKALAANPDQIKVDDYKAYFYQILPLRGFSKVFGFVGEKQLPRPVLSPILNFYCWYFNVDLDEALEGSLDKYRSLSEFFQRELKPEVREIDQKSPLIVPCDGRVLHFGKCENGVVEQVKGVQYPVERFLGCQPPLTDAENNDLFYCVLYLAPGDYHLFHSPCEWTIDKVIHFPGTLMSVNPSVCKRVPNILTLNERVLLSGAWKHGYFTYTAVGATNVGSIRINFLKDKIKTNEGFLSFNKDTEIDVEPKQDMHRGEMVGGFNFGSTIVLMFEAPKSFQFNIKTDQVIRLGRPLGHIGEDEVTGEGDVTESEDEVTGCEDVAQALIGEIEDTFHELVNGLSLDTDSAGSNSDLDQENM